MIVNSIVTCLKVSLLFSFSMDLITSYSQNDSNLKYEKFGFMVKKFNIEVVSLVSMHVTVPSH